MNWAAKRISVLLTGAALLLQLGCSSLGQEQPSPQRIPAPVRQAEISRYGDWQALGRIALKSDQEAISASLDWQQQGTDYAVALTAALGQRALYIKQAGEQATLQARGATVQGHSAELLVLAELGVRVPLAELAYWLRGLPGNLGSAQYDQFGRLHTLNYQDPDGRRWRARVTSYRLVQELELPKRIDLSDGTYAIRVVVSDWLLGERRPAAQQTTPQRIAIPGATS